MIKQRPIILIVLLLYILTPGLLQWITDPEGAWYRPFIVWLSVIAIAFIVQVREESNDL